MNVLQSDDLPTRTARRSGPSRSTLWLINFGVLQRHAPQSWPKERDRHRQRYSWLKSTLLVAPDGRLPNIFESDNDSNHAKPRPDADVDVNDPLSLSDDNPWQAHFERLTSFEQISKDVERAFPDERERFLAAHNDDSDSFHRQLSGVLATWSLIEDNVSIGYRQGMHEIAAVCWLVVKEDATRAAAAGDLISQRSIESDTFTLFDAIMKRASPFYAWRPTTIAAAATAAATPASSASSSTMLPILQRCEIIQESLRANDPALFRFLASARIAVQIFAVRWLRLLFLRELRLDTVLTLWDAMFDVDASLHLIDHVCVALLVRMRDTVMNSSHTECLRVLMATQDRLIESDHSVHALIHEARQAHRRFTAVRSGFVKLADDDEQHDRDAAFMPLSSSPFNLQAAASFLASRGSAVTAQSLGAGFSKALDSVQRTAYAAYQAHVQPKDANSDGFPPSISSLSYTGNTRRPSQQFGGSGNTSHSSFARLPSTPHQPPPLFVPSASSKEGRTEPNRPPPPPPPPPHDDSATRSSASFDPLGANAAL